MSIFNTGKPLNKFTKIVPVFLTINNKYAPYAAVAIKSLMEQTNKKRYYRVIILHDGLSWKSRFKLRSLVTKNCAIQFKKITNSLYLRMIIRYCSKKKGQGDFFSSAVYYYRAFIAQLFPLYDKAVYIDSDTVFLQGGDVGELFDMDLEEKTIGAKVDTRVEAIPEFRKYVETAIGIPYKEYVNSGVLVMDLKKMRKMHYLKKMIDLIEKYDADLVAPDQDYLNVILRGDIKFLDSCWNEEPSEENLQKTKLIHFNLQNKPWHYKGIPGEKLFWQVAKRTGFYGDLKRQRANFNKADKKAEEEKILALVEKAERLAEAKELLIKL